MQYILQYSTVLFTIFFQQCGWYTIGLKKQSCLNQVCFAIASSPSGEVRQCLQKVEKECSQPVIKQIIDGLISFTEYVCTPAGQKGKLIYERSFILLFSFQNSHILMPLDAGDLLSIRKA